MVATSMDQLKKQIMDQMNKAMWEVEKRSRERIDDAILHFYSGGTPVMYQRTGHLMDTRKTDPVVYSGLSLQFRAYLDEGVGGYATGVHPSMLTVLWLTNYGNRGLRLRNAVGSRNWWKQAETNIGKDLDSIFGKYF